MVIHRIDRDVRSEVVGCFVKLRMREFKQVVN